MSKKEKKRWVKKRKRGLGVRRNDELVVNRR